jgi:predicted AAA+ superfamily ATPase
MVQRPRFLERLRAAVSRSPVTALLGPRQCGKTTLAGMFARGRSATFYDLESQPDLRRLQNPELALAAERGLVVLDEIQARPELFGVLRVLADRPRSRSRFLVLGSASPDIVRGASESLAGRVEFVELAGFDLTEAGTGSWQRLWLRGGFPRSWLAKKAEDSRVWREGLIRTFLERDVPQLGITIPAAAMRRFWTMLAHYHGQTWNASEIAGSMGLSDKTVRSYLDILTGTFMVRQLQPWHENVGKRQVKAPKVFLRDSGLLHSLLDLADRHRLFAHPRVGASFEGFVIEEVLRAVAPQQAFFWATYGGAELDLFFLRDGRRYGVEVKFSEAPSTTRSMRTAIEALSLDHLWVVYPGRHAYPADGSITMWPVSEIPRLPEALDRSRSRPRRRVRTAP